MKKKTKPLDKYFKFPRLYLEDIEEIFSVLSGGGKTKIEIESEGYEFETLDELKNNYSRINELKLHRSDPYISIDLTKSQSRVFCLGDSIEASGIFKKISDIIKIRERKLVWFLNGILFFSSWAAVGLVFMIDRFALSKYITLSIMFVALIIIILSIPNIFKSYTIPRTEIFLEKRKEIKGYFSRNKDQLSNIAISVLFTAILTFLITWYFFTRK